MINFYPGPSKVYEGVPKYVKDAWKEGVLSINHRSDEFESISSKAISLLKTKLYIPVEYSVFFTSSATECWEIIAQSLIDKNSFHFYNGSFGQKWFDHTRKLKPNAMGFRFDMEQEIDPNELTFGGRDGVICLTQNETSNGTQVSDKVIKGVREKNPDKIIAVDATSSMAGVPLDFKNADVWYASVQKCFGLPAGLGIMVCSPKAISMALSIADDKHYNSLPLMIEKMKVFQTTHTPNVMGIYLLQRVLEKIKPIEEEGKRVHKQYLDWVSFFSNLQNVRLMINNDKVRSHTVLVIEATPQIVADLKYKAKEKGIILGNGYGELKDNTFRIANFPAINKKEIKQLMAFLKKQLK